MMARMLDQARYKCALGAMQTVQSIEGAIPVLHSGPGCAYRLNDNKGTSGHFSQNIYPCTGFGETEVIFGGEAKLKNTIENALRIIDAELFVVMTGCTSEIIGDNVESIVNEFADAKKPVIYVNTPGFKGSNYLGHEWVLTAIIEQFLDDYEVVETTEGLVNIFAGPPIQDPFWLGNLRELERLVAAIGLTPNTVFGHARGIPSLKRVPHAQLNVLVSPWVGLDSVKLLEKKYGTPYLHCPILPIGAFETSKFLRMVGASAKTDPLLLEQVIDAYEKEYYYYIERYADIFLELRIMSKRFTTVSDAQYSLALTKFLVNDLGMFPTKQFITDNTPQGYHSLIDAEFRSLNYGIEAEVEYSSNGFDIHRQIKEMDFAGVPLVLGSSWDKSVADEIKGHYLNISYPVVERLIINGSLAGYAGGLKLLEDLYSHALTKSVI
jgi:nitrogenase molybdenum-iron protein beta chain